MERMAIVNGSIITFDPANPVVAPGRVLIEDGRIASVEAWDGHGEYPTATSTLIDAGGRYVLPGLVCAHHHFYSALARGFAPAGKPPADFTAVLESLWWPLDRALTAEDIAISARVSLLDCIARGVTTVFDHHESQGAQAGSLETIAAAVRGSGIRACLALGVSDRQGKAGEGIAEIAAFAPCAAHDGMIRACAGIHASFTASDSTLAMVAKTCALLGIGLHAHLCEAVTDNRASVEKFGGRPLDRFERAGLLGPRTLLAHGVHLNDSEMHRIAGSGSILVHNPESNMNNAVGLAPVGAALSAGAVVGLGTDGMSSDVIAQARASILVRRHTAGSPSAGFADAWKMLSYFNPEIASRFFGPGLGVIGRGCAGDVVVMDAIPPTPVEAGNAAGHVLFGLAGAVSRDVVCAGRLIRSGGRTLTFDEAAVMTEARARAAELWARIRRK